MNDGGRPRSPQDVQRFDRSISFLYFERCRIDQSDLSVVVIDDEGTIAIPVANLASLLLGPGVRITHRAMSNLADHGCSVVWVGEEGVRFYAGGVGRARKTHFTERHAQVWGNPRERARMSRVLYRLRFPGENVAGLSVAQLRGREGARIRHAYRLASRRTGVPWDGRVYDPDDWWDSDPVNRALSSANACLYGLAHAAIAALGLIHGLGFIHTGTALSFVYDVADLYKAEIAIPAAFEAAADDPPDIGNVVRRAMRDHFRRSRLMEKMVADLVVLFGEDFPNDEALEELSQERYLIGLWDPEFGTLPGGRNYADDLEWPEEPLW